MTQSEQSTKRRDCRGFLENARAAKGARGHVGEREQRTRELNTQSCFIPCNSPRNRARRVPSVRREGRAQAAMGRWVDGKDRVSTEYSNSHSSILLHD